MYTLINDLWMSQPHLPFNHQITIPQTIVIHPGFKIQWFFSKANKILKKSEPKCTVEAVLQFIQSNNIRVNLITVNMPYMAHTFPSIDLMQQRATLQELTHFLHYYQQFPHLIENPIIIQEIISDSQCITLSWNKNFTYYQQCNDQSFDAYPKESQITQHFRLLLDKLTTELVNKIQYIHHKKGVLEQLKLVYALSDKPHFLWCNYAQFDKESLVRNINNDGKFWMKSNLYQLNFSAISQPKKEAIVIPQKRRCISNQENDINILLDSQQNGKSTNRSAINTSRSNHTNRSITNTSRSIIQSTNKSLITQLRNRSNSNKSQSISRLSHRDQILQVNHNGSNTHRTDTSEIDISRPSIKRVKKPLSSLFQLKCRLTDHQLQLL